ncbi:MAG TPA: helix-turn-helix transcriptional regulator [Pedococcus sp.]|jgi:HTH-type transcriptional regulator/antitoxin HipB|nr:helix-turn-helix transcriptional regulator [Pedococcus sp.]
MEPNGRVVMGRNGGADAAREPFDAGRYLARARRRADLSQRELAALARVSQSQVAAFESGTRRVHADTLDLLLSLAGLRLAVVDEQGNEVDPFAVETARDNAGRRYPAHLDVQPPDQLPGAWSPRYDRAQVRAWYQRREERDRRRASGRASGEHPTEPELQYRRLSRMYGRTPWWQARSQALAMALGVDPERACQ